SIRASDDNEPLVAILLPPNYLPTSQEKKSYTQNQDNDKHSLTAISESNKYPVRCRKKANHILNDYSPVIVVIPSKQSNTIFNIWNRLRKKTENNSNLLQKNETQFLRNLFPPAKVELDEDINGYLDNIFSIF
ncbi:2564_t:CDS:2, partial [Scutellospora calospora]